jgi:hypothetical protein
LNHLLLGCCFIREVWCILLLRLHLQVQIPSGGARANTKGVRLPCGCVGFFYVGANMVKI